VCPRAAKHAKNNSETSITLDILLVLPMKIAFFQHPVRLPPGFRWSKKNWAKEAGVNKDTPVAKKGDGTFKFAEETEAYERLRAGQEPRPGRAQRLMNENSRLRDENTRLKRALADCVT
jgi:hypothetical protein